MDKSAKASPRKKVMVSAKDITERHTEGISEWANVVVAHSTRGCRNGFHACRGKGWTVKEAGSGPPLPLPNGGHADMQLIDRYLVLARGHVKGMA